MLNRRLIVIAGVVPHGSFAQVEVNTGDVVDHTAGKLRMVVQGRRGSDVTTLWFDDQDKLATGRFGLGALSLISLAPKEPPEFQVNDVVRFRHGGPTMTYVGRFRGGYDYVVQWFDKSTHLRETRCAGIMLEKA